ncbi:MAG: SurA N-terminal domain-containing protein [Oleiphilaceae bacterium]|nr:SurA N-terminal domain-containing protein [Oleiphilaceae bacterium]
MLQDIRENAQGTIAKIIVGLLILALSMFGVDAIIGGFSSEPEVATVNDEPITEREFTRVVQMERQRQLSEMDTPDPSLLDDDQIRQSALESMIRDEVLTQDAARQGLELSDEDVDRLITQMSQFEVGGEFSRERFVSVIRNMGMGPMEFRDAMRRQYIANQIRAGVLESGLVSPQAVDHILGLQYQARDFRTFTLSPAAVESEVSVTEADVEAYYEDNSRRFMQPERIDAAYIELSLQDLAKAVEVSDSELQEFYQAEAGSLAKEERKVAHILIEGDTDEASETLEEVQEKLEAGESFAALAESYSDDLASARDGGDLGYISREMFDADFEEAAFALEEGEVSDPVQTTFGVHLIKLEDVRKTEAPAFEDVKSELAEQLAMEKAGERFSEIRSRLVDLAYAEDNLTVPAEELGLKVQTRSNVTRDGGDEPFDHAGLIRQLFSEDVLEAGYNTELIDLAPDTSVVARVRDYKPAARQPLDEVRDDIRQQLTQQRTREALAALGEKLVADLEQGAELNDLEVAPDSWQSYEAVTRSTNSVDSAVIDRTFSLPRPQGDSPSYGMTRSGQDLVVIALDGVTEGQVEDKQEERERWQSFIASQMAQREYMAYRQRLRERAEIERP